LYFALKKIPNDGWQKPYPCYYYFFSGNRQMMMYLCGRIESGTEAKDGW